MAGSVNKAVLVGNLGKDPEVRHAQNGGKIVSFSLATSEQWKDASSGEPKSKTEWHRIVIFNEKLGEVAEKFLKKGSKVYLEGQLQTRKWVDNQGQEKYTTEIALMRYRGELTLLDRLSSSQDGMEGPLDKPSDKPSSSPQENSPSRGSLRGSSGRSGKEMDDFDDEIPF